MRKKLIFGHVLRYSWCVEKFMLEFLRISGTFREERTYEILSHC